MGKFEKDNVTIQKITLHERFQVTDIENEACVCFSFASPLPLVWLFDLVQPKYVEGHRFSPPSPLRDGWGRFWLLPFSRYWTGGHTERLEKYLLAFKQILIIFEVFSLKFVSRVCKYKFMIRPQSIAWSFGPSGIFLCLHPCNWEMNLTGWGLSSICTETAYSH